jgi:hypothetical protein
LQKISEVVEIRKGRVELETYLRKKLSNLSPDDKLIWICSLRWRAIFTTNYDDGIEKAYEVNPYPKQKPISVSITSELLDYDPRFDIPVYHLHGSLFRSENSRIIITEDDYTRFSEQRKMLFELLKREFITSTVLYIGYSNKDYNWNLLISEISKEFYPSVLPHSYRVSPVNDTMDIEILKNRRNIETIVAT